MIRRVLQNTLKVLEGFFRIVLIVQAHAAHKQRVRIGRVLHHNVAIWNETQRLFRVSHNNKIVSQVIIPNLSC